jgi:hypothetical protein
MTDIVTSNGKKIVLNRSYKETPDYGIPEQFKVGISQSTPTVATTDLDVAIPILNGTVNDDGSNTFTGSSGGDNSTDNTSTYKQGAQTTDATAQNLIANNTNASKIWTISDLASAGTNCDASKYCGLWLYIKDTTALAKFKTSGTALEIRIGADSTTNYYSLVLEASDLAVGWNWVYSELLSSWTSNGTPGTLNDFQIIITTNNATDTFVAGDVVYDLLRQWETTDILKDFITGYPSINETSLQATMRMILTSTQANGFLIDSVMTFNKDGTPLGTDVSTFTADSKSDTDEFIFQIVNQVS